MWHREYRDYKTDESNIKNQVEPGRGICGCEMHEIYGWGNLLHQPKKQKPQWIASFFRKRSQ